MRYIVVFLLIYSSFVASGQTNFINIVPDKWIIEASKAELLIESKLTNLKRDNNRLYQKYLFAKTHYNAVVVYNAKIDWSEYLNNHTIRFRLEEDSDTPYCLYYVDKRGNIKFVVDTAYGTVVYVDSFNGAIWRRANRQARIALRSILRKQPQFIFECDNLPPSFLFPYNDSLYIHTFFEREPQPIEDYLIKNKDDISKHFGIKI